jgi:hypothetical protein
VSDIGSVHNYATVGMRLWAARKAPHGPEHDCLTCADTREYFGDEPLERNPYRVMIVPTETREEEQHGG